MSKIILKTLSFFLLLFVAFIPIIIPGGIPVYDAIASAQRNIALTRQASELSLQSIMATIDQYWNDFDLNSFILSQGIRIISRTWVNNVDFDYLGTFKYINTFLPSSFQVKLSDIYDLAYGRTGLVLPSYPDFLYNNILDLLGYPYPVPNSTTNISSMPDNIFSRSAYDNKEYIKDPLSPLMLMQTNSIAEGYAASASFMNAVDLYEKRYREWQIQLGIVSSNQYSDEKAYLKLIVSYLNMTADNFRLSLLDKGLNARINSTQLSYDYHNTLNEVNSRRSSYLTSNFVLEMLEGK